jgi:hypothetical protein
VWNKQLGLGWSDNLCIGCLDISALAAIRWESKKIMARTAFPLVRTGRWQCGGQAQRADVQLRTAYRRLLKLPTVQAR